MQFSIFQHPLNSWQGSTLVIGLYEEEIADQLKRIEFIIEIELLLERFKSKNFNGLVGEYLTLDLLNKGLQTIIFIGMGKKDNLNNDIIRKTLSDGIRKLVEPAEKISILLPWESFKNKDAAYCAAETARLSLFKDNRFRSKNESKGNPKIIEFLNLKVFSDEKFKDVSSLCDGIEFARELVAAPPNSLTPKELSKQAVTIAEDYGMEVNILDSSQCEKLGMGAYLAVAKGSDLDPKFIHLILKSENPHEKRIAFVGKGLTFDSGGYNLKVGASQIEMMKYDMGGSAAVLGAAKALGAIKPNGLEIHFIVAACENMINGSAVHPGDVVKASNGKTIEINNTDAEGRLTLADALHYASNLKPDTIVDLATLTGACVIALGNDVAGLWSNNNILATELLDSSLKSGEGLWQMPLQKSYKDGLKSHIADMKNTGPRAGGSITAALFLEEFVDNNIDWAHIDIAGTCWTEKNNGENPSGATGYGVRTLVQWVKDQSLDPKSLI